MQGSYLVIFQALISKIEVQEQWLEYYLKASQWKLDCSIKRMKCVNELINLKLEDTYAYKQLCEDTSTSLLDVDPHQLKEKYDHVSYLWGRFNELLEVFYGENPQHLTSKKITFDIEFIDAEDDSIPYDSPSSPGCGGRS
jgi:hypothetical protein